MDPNLLMQGLTGAKSFRALPLQRKLDNRAEYPPLNFEEVISTVDPSDNAKFGSQIIGIQALLDGNRELQEFLRSWPPYQESLRRLNQSLKNDKFDFLKNLEFVSLKKGVQSAIDSFPKAIKVNGIYLLNKKGRASAIDFEDKVDKAIKKIQVAGIPEYVRFLAYTRIVNIDPTLECAGQAFVYDRWTDIRSVSNIQHTASTLIHESAHHELKPIMRGGQDEDDYEFTIHSDDRKNLHDYSPRINVFINEAYAYLTQGVFEIDYLKKFQSFGLDEVNKRFQKLDVEWTMKKAWGFLKYLAQEEAQGHIKDKGIEIISAMLTSLEDANREYLALRQSLGIEK